MPTATPNPDDTEDASLTGRWPTIVYVGQDPWQLQHPTTAIHRTEAFTDAPSYLPGETVRLAVSTDAASYTVEIFRIGPTVKPVARSPLLHGVRQPPPVVDAATRMVSAPWKVSWSIVVPDAWRSGVYLAKISGTRSTQGYATFVVRSTRPSRFLFVSNPLNAAAYNTWGGSSLYWTGIGQPAAGVSRALAVSLDRPFAEEKGAGQVFTMEAPFIGWLERNGYDVTYTTDYDLSIHPDAQPLPGAVLFSGHDEYWGAGLRDWLDEHVLVRGDMGLGVFAADTGYWQVGLEGTSPTGPRTITLQKTGSLDPVARARCGGQSADFANAFRLWPCGWPDVGNRPEQDLLGVQYGAMATGRATYRLTTWAPGWLLAGTRLAPGAALGALAGGEIDVVDPQYSIPAGNRIIATASVPTIYGTRQAARAVLRTTAAGGRVFASGTFWWAWGLERTFAAANGVPRGFQRLTRNILEFLAPP